MKKRVFLVDNYDSFTFNLYQGLAASGADVRVERNNEFTVSEVLAWAPTHVVLSPGPGHPKNLNDVGRGVELLKALNHTVPTLGVCLGLQTMVFAAGGGVVPAPSIVHGKTSLVRHSGAGLFDGLPNPMVVMRYHSWVVERASLPDCFEPTAETEDGLVMAAARTDGPVVGVQFHPESIGTPEGQQLLNNFLAMEAVA